MMKWFDKEYRKSFVTDERKREGCPHEFTIAYPVIGGEVVPHSFAVCNMCGKDLEE